VEIETIKSAIITRVKEINQLKEAKKEYLKDMREHINELEEQVVNLTTELENAEREELTKDADAILESE
jgi:hypothetical protein